MFKENYIITGNIVCETGLHIGGSNDNLEIGGSDNVILRDSVSNLPFIPGSSLKGKLRSLLELNDKESCDSVISNGGKPSKGSCIATEIFGIGANNEGKKFPTRVIIRDSYPTKETIEMWNESEEILRGSELKYENSLNRINSKATPRNIERVPKGSMFSFEFIFSIYDGDDENNLNRFIESIRLLEDNYLGGSGSRGFGKVKFDNIKIVKRDSDYYKENNEETVLCENVNLRETLNL